MVTLELLDFIKNQREKGKKDEEIQKTLHHSGWKDIDIAEAFHTKATDLKLPVPQASHTLILPNMESLIGKSIDIYKRIWTKVALAVGITFAMIVVLILLVAGVFLLILSQRSLIELSSTPGNPLTSGIAVAVFFGLIIVAIISVICFLYITLWGQLVVVHLINNW